MADFIPYYTKRLGTWLRRADRITAAAKLSVATGEPMKYSASYCYSTWHTAKHHAYSDGSQLARLLGLAAPHSAEALREVYAAGREAMNG